jgi:hypothetical protein
MLSGIAIARQRIPGRRGGKPVTNRFSYGAAEKQNMFYGVYILMEFTVLC